VTQAVLTQREQVVVLRRASASEPGLDNRHSVDQGSKLRVPDRGATASLKQEKYRDSIKDVVHPNRNCAVTLFQRGYD